MGVMKWEAIKMADIKSNLLVTLVFDKNVDIRKRIDTECAVKAYIRNILQHAIASNNIEHFVIADDEVINKKLTQERKVGKWIDSEIFGEFKCSCCGNYWQDAEENEYEDWIKMAKFCPVCGAEM